jgi:iron complex outermembrane receptor protein
VVIVGNKFMLAVPAAGRGPRKQALTAIVVLALLSLFTSVADAAPFQQAVGSVEVVVVDSGTQEIIRLSVAHVMGDARANVTGGEGRFRIANLSPGIHQIHVAGVNYGERIETVEVRAGETTRLTVGLEFEAYAAPQIVVQAMRPDLLPDSQLTSDMILEENPRDVGELLRTLPGVDSVRRGPLGFDPVVRGLRESEVGVYLDNGRVFPGGAARMDSALSHFDPGAVQSVEVVAGPYTLTWGAGNLSAIRAKTQEVPPGRAGWAHGDVRFGYDSNMNALETVGTVAGRADAVSYWGYGVYRQGDDYEDGDGGVVPADFLSREGRGKLGYQFEPNSNLTFSAGYQQQRDVDYPGRLLDAEFFDALHIAGDWTYRGTEGTVRGANVNLYFNDVDHGMTNDNKPTAQAMPGRVPPFGLDIGVATGSQVTGGRGAAEVEVGGAATAEVGGDFYRSNRDATRTITRRSNGMTLAMDHPWPDVDIDDYGLYGKLESPLSAVNVAGTARLDIVRATADESIVSDFFVANTEGPLDADETNFSAALTASVPAGRNWMVSGGLGSAVRTADALERYSDRFPASKAQMAAEFMGDPQISPERSTQADIWIDGRYDRASFSFAAYYRDVSDYITIEATDLPKKLPLSPDTVFRYVNGEAKFWGLEYRTAFNPVEDVTVFVRGDYTWGEDKTHDEPAIGLSPVRAWIGANYAFGGGYDVEAVVNLAGAQDRVAAKRGETPTEGYTTLDLRVGARLLSGLNLRGGVLNATNEFYVNHLNAKNPFTGAQVPEPGRVFFIKASYTF